MEQLSLFDGTNNEINNVVSETITVIDSNFVKVENTNWIDLFQGYDELYGITFSSGIHFFEKIVNLFGHVEMIFGCEDVISNDIAVIMSFQTDCVERLAKSKSASRLAERIDEGSLSLYVSRDTKSHEKIFILKAKDGRTRVITGSANMSASAFLNYQRENIIKYDDVDAYEYFIDRFHGFKDKCADNVNHKVINGLISNENYIRDNIDEIPIFKTIDKEKVIILEQDANSSNDEIEIVADIKGLEKEIKPLLPKQKADGNKILLTGEFTKAFKQKYSDHKVQKKFVEKHLPKLHINYENQKVTFNEKEIDLNPSDDTIKSDVSCIESYMSSLSSFYGDWRQSQRDYFAFMNWYFASPFMPYLRYVAYKNNYDVTPFPVMGIIYGDSNGGKSTFVKLLSKLMCGRKIPLNSSGDFTTSNISKLKASCEGLPIIIDDLAKDQYSSHYEKIIKDDTWGILEHFVNYPAVVITTNKLPSIKPDISKRTIACHIETKLDKEAGARNSKRINESIHQAGTALYGEYMHRMFSKIFEMENEMKSLDKEYFPDIFEVSSDVLCQIFEKYSDDVPDYVCVHKYADYFGEKAIGRSALNKIMIAWESDKKAFVVDRKRNKLIYSYPESGRLYELTYIQQELPPVLNAKLTSKSIVMDLDKAKEVFGIEFKKGIF